MFVEDYERLSDQNESLKRELATAKSAQSGLARAIARLPERWYLKCAVESVHDGDEEGERFLSACLMEEPPPEGWTIPTYFNEPPGVKRAHTEEWLEPYRHNDIPRVAVTSGLDDVPGFQRQIVQMIEERFK